MVKSILRAFLVVMALAGLNNAADAAETISIPFTVTIASFPSDSTASSSLDEKDVREIFAEVNKTWKVADIQCDVKAVKQIEIPLPEGKSLSSFQDRSALRKLLLDISPKSSDGKMWNVLVIKSFPVKGAGVYLPETKTIIYSETTNEGKTKPLVLAHEIGHSLGLAHDNMVENLMHRRHRPNENAEVPTVITDAQIATVRNQALVGPMDIDLAHDLRASSVAGEGGRTVGNKNREGMASRFKKFDYDKDGRVSLSDIPSERGKTIFRSADMNKDDVLDEQELEALGQRR